MHIEKNICDSVVGTLLNIEGKSKDTNKARLDLEDMKIRKELHLIKRGDKWMKPHAAYTLSADERKKFCKFLKSVKFPDGYAANISNNVSEDDGKISGLKSHDCHMLFQRLLPAGIRPLLKKEISETLIEFSNFFQQICSRTLHVNDLEKLNKDIVFVLCKLERIFPPAFFNVMIHLAIHLPYEAILAGPVHTRWMYPIERNLGTLKQYVRNKARPEGSIAEAYVVNEALIFCSMYFGDIEKKFYRPERNYVVDKNEVRHLSVFKNNVRPLGKKEVMELPTEDHKRAHCEHMEELKRTESRNLEQLQENSFPKWFEDHELEECDDSVEEYNNDELNLDDADSEDDVFDNDDNSDYESN
ncbi:Uncharacterized protein Adt_45554 [Abeliophyllum distichum]|uniref:DUF4218 domain-containing protein n=1 Tax=Abeliophyllum distichum TaxID=126358 RepID=A0ABD1NUK9_9LAMI